MKKQKQEHIAKDNAFVTLEQAEWMIKQAVEALRTELEQPDTTQHVNHLERRIAHLDERVEALEKKVPPK